MANAWHVHFEPTVVHLKPAGGGKFASVTATPGTTVNPPGGSFPVVTSVRLNLTDDAQGPPPAKPGDPSVPATLELIGRAKPLTPTGAAPFVSLGVVKGKAGYNTAGTKPVPQFVCGSVKVPGGGVSTTIDFTPATTPEVAHSDWVMRIEKHPDTFDTNAVQSFFVKLPWQFVENPGRMQLSARLTINGTLAADENRNTPLDIPLKHDSVPEEATPGRQLLTFFGLRNLYSRVNANSPSAPVPFAGRTLRVILHATFTSFCTSSTSATVADVSTALTQILNDAGFGSVSVPSGAAADTECGQHWKPVGGHFMGHNITDPNQNQPAADRLENRFSAAIAANQPGSVTIPAGMEERIPFFDFYVFAEAADAPSPTELAHSEGLIPVTGSVGGVIPAQAIKALTTPLIIAKGITSASPLRNLLGQIDKADHANLLAGTIAHEIGHTFGLRHAVAFRGNLPYESSDPDFGRGTMALAGLSTGSGTPRVPLYFFGPIHQLEIKRLYL